jgi:hypothetical protein
LLGEAAPASSFALWAGQKPGKPLCGYQAWKGEPLRVNRNYELWLRDPGAFQRLALLGEDPRRLCLQELVERVFQWVGTPMEVDHLVQGLAELRQEKAPRKEEAIPELMEERVALADSAPTVLEEYYRAEILCASWQEIRALPRAQRWALLLHLKTDEIARFVEYGCCSHQQIAEALEIPRGEFDALSGTLPLPDKLIASRLGLTQRKVINCRASAQKRLCRRLKVSWNA